MEETEMSSNVAYMSNTEHIQTEDNAAYVTTSNDFGIRTTESNLYDYIKD